ncbi:MAG: pre-peptidase C-terminal domain-containing protein [Treponema sp.]|nr:pre-peptidase C-terminal domain-containing protein [Treponema sp.]
MKKVLCLLIALLFITGGVFAQYTQELRIGSTISSRLNAGEQIIYIVRTTRAGTLTVETHGDIDTVMEVYENENYITYDDDGGEGFNAKVVFDVLPNKIYHFYISGYDSNVNGQFRISASQQNFPNPAELRIGSSVNVNMSGGQEFWYRVRSANSGFINVKTTGDIDTYLLVYDDSYNYITENDDGGEDLNALVEIFAEANKTYLIRLRGYSEEVSGRTSISAAFEAIPPDPGNISRDRAIPVIPGEVLSIFFRSDSESRWYVYEVTRTGTTHTIQTRGDIDTVMYLYDRNGNLITEDDDSGDSLNARIIQRLNAGTYYIEIKEYWGTLGRCNLHIEFRQN